MTSENQGVAVVAFKDSQSREWRRGGIEWFTEFPADLTTAWFHCQCETTPGPLAGDRFPPPLAYISSSDHTSPSATDVLIAARAISYLPGPERCVSGVSLAWPSMRL